jgi:hypothetical protein
MRRQRNVRGDRGGVPDPGRSGRSGRSCRVYAKIRKGSELPIQAKTFIKVMRRDFDPVDPSQTTAKRYMRLARIIADDDSKTTRASFWFTSLAGERSLYVVCQLRKILEPIVVGPSRQGCNRTIIE